MKELSIEEKAKAYDEAIERAKNYYSTTDSVADTELIELIFPELKESEDDRIRKELIFYLRYQHSISENFKDIGKWVAWLEKQGEQKPILDVEIPFGAKDSELQEASYNIPNGYHAEIEDNKVVIKKGEQKPAWSEEDEEIHRKCICAMRASACGFPEEEKFVEQVDNWLKSIKDRVQPKQEWNEEDEDYINDLIKYFSQNEKLENTKEDVIAWLKSLKLQTMEAE